MKNHNSSSRTHIFVLGAVIGLAIILVGYQMERTSAKIVKPTAITTKQIDGKTKSLVTITPTPLVKTADTKPSPTPLPSATYKKATQSTPTPTPVYASTKPVVSFSTPTNGATVGANPIVTIHSNAPLGFNQVSVEIECADGSCPGGSYSGNAASYYPTYSFTWDTESYTLPNGQYKLVAKLQDNTGDFVTSSIILTLSR